MRLVIVLTIGSFAGRYHGISLRHVTVAMSCPIWTCMTFVTMVKIYHHGTRDFQRNILNIR